MITFTGGCTSPGQFLAKASRRQDARVPEQVPSAGVCDSLLSSLSLCLGVSVVLRVHQNKIFSPICISRGSPNAFTRPYGFVNVPGAPILGLELSRIVVSMVRQFAWLKML